MIFACVVYSLRRQNVVGWISGVRLPMLTLDDMQMMLMTTRTGR